MAVVGDDLQDIATRVRAHLQDVAQHRVPITYRDLAKALRLSPPKTIHQVGEALERLMEEDAEVGLPFIAALVISKARGGLPAPGFFACARRLGRFVGDARDPEASTYHATEFNAAVMFWSNYGGKL